MKKSKLFYRFIDESRNTQDVAEEAIKNMLVKATPSTSCWWSKMKTTVSGFGSLQEEIQRSQERYLLNGEEANFPRTTATTKTCPGIIELLKDAYLIKSPTEVIVTIDSNDAHYYNVADSSIMDVSGHARDQFYQADAPLFEGKSSIKFNIKVSIKAEGFNCMMADPMYHNKLDFSVPMGILSETNGGVHELSVITFVDTPQQGETKTIHIKEGDVLAYLIPFKKCNLSFSEQKFNVKRFVKAFNWRKDK